MDDLKTQAMLSELEQQRNWALTRCASLAAELTVAQQTILKLQEAKPEE